MRGFMMLAGALAGVGLYALSQALEAGLLADRAGLALSASVASFFIAFLALAGPVGPRAAAVGAAFVSVVAAAGLVLAGTRFATAEDLVESGRAPFAFFATLLLPLPFWIARHRGNWRSYPALFTESWGIVIRYGSALLFTGLVWGVLALSDALLGLVGIKVLDPVFDVPGLTWAITGAALGLALAVMEEWQDERRFALPLRLLRLMLPVVLVVVLVFLAALPLRGLSGLLGELSVAVTLVSMVAAAVTLVTVALDVRDGQGVQTPLMRNCTRLLALILPLPAGLALWSVMMRVGEYGWTPQRVLATTAAVVGLVYGLTYLAAALRGGWQGAIRQANVWLAVGLLAIALLWQTPLLDSERISARSQAARIAAGHLPGAESLRAFRYWGKAGERLLAQLEETAEGDLALQLQHARAGAPPAVTVADFAALLPIRPDGSDGAALLRGLDATTRAEWAALCRNRLPDGRAGCVLILGAFHPDRGGDQAIFIGNDVQHARIDGIYLEGVKARPTYVEGGNPDHEPEDLLRQALDGRFGMAPVLENRLLLDGLDLRLGP
ncbi:DUF4153 domain-containing protein [Falsirhodobacter deserti]|uniref:DUF4153 domain-containing protein n=1 Tax=Falsirhodobacter deserti TaxID=1365611 RepID=UPI0013E33077|nr:DUF4153 domain-containing protein [Falsirhodobacter deserti]